MLYLTTLLRRYAARFDGGAPSARLHHAVRRLRENRTATTTTGGAAGAAAAAARVMQPEALWAQLRVPMRCGDSVWWRDPR